MDLSVYKQDLRLNPHAVNTGTWYARSFINHNGRGYAAGVQLPNEGDHALTNEQVANLLDVNALTSVNPNKTVEQEQLPPTQQQPQNPPATDENGNPLGAAPAGSEAPGGLSRLDENGNPIQQ